MFLESSGYGSGQSFRPLGTLTLPHLRHIISNMLRSILAAAFFVVSALAQTPPCILMALPPTAPSLFPSLTCAPPNTTAPRPVGTPAACANPASATQPILVIKAQDGTCVRVIIVLPGQTATNATSTVLALHYPVSGRTAHPYVIYRRGEPHSPVEIGFYPEPHPLEGSTAALIARRHVFP